MNATKFQIAGKHQTAGKFQTPSSKLQGSSKQQASRGQVDWNRILEFGIWDFSGAWSLVFGALCLMGFLHCTSNSAFASQPSISLSGLPLSFEPQEAMVGDSVAYFARGQNYQFAITATGAQIVLSKTESDPNRLSGHASRITHHAPHTVQMHLLGANAYAPIHADGLLSGKMNYLLGNDPSQWRTDLPLYSKVQVDDVYPGINLVYYGNQDQLEYDFVLAPRARPEHIALNFEGADKIEINKDGELVLSFEGNEIRFHRPDIYQEANGVRRPISGGYQFENSRTVSFSVGNYDRDLPLIIDPILAYSGYFGGNFGDVALAVKVDSSGFIYIAGETLSRKWPFPLTGADTNFNGGRFNGDGFVAKLSNDASNLVYFTYIGGSEDDGVLDLALDSAGNPYITGSTDSTNFPTLNAAFPKIRGFRDPTFHTIPSDAFVAELSRLDGSLQFSTYLGGSGADVAGAITVDSATNIYVTGYTYSTDFPTTSGLFTNIQPTLVGYTNKLMGSNDIFVAKIAPGGQGIKYVTLFGGTGLDTGEGIAVDDSEHVYICGYTGSTNFITTTNALPGTNGLGIRHINGVTNDVQVYRGVRNIPFDAFLTRFDTTQSGTNSLEYSTLFGGKYNDAAFRMVLYSNTDVILTGNSRSPDFPTNNFPAPHKTAAGAGNADAILVRFSFAANSVVTNPPGIFYSTLFGGASEDVGWGLALDPSGNVYVVGITSSGDFPGTNGLTANGAPFLRTNHIALRDVFVTAFSNDASAILYSVMMGGNNEDYGYGIDVDSSGNAYVVGRTVSGNFPFTNASSLSSSLFVPKRNGTNDAFLAKILAINSPAPPPPMLKSKLVGSGGIQLAWPHSATGYVLESNTNLANPAGWVPVTGFPLTTNNGIIQVQVPMTNGSLFFRLRR